MVNRTVKHTIRRIAVCVLAVLVLGGCFNQWDGDTAAITINLSGGPGRAADPLDDETLARLIFIVDFSGPSTFTIETQPGERTINVSVASGRYVITATAYLDGEVYARGSTSAQARTGHPTPVPLVLYRAENDTVINRAVIEGVTAPVTDGTPVTAITENAQYSGTVTWSPDDSTFTESTAYTATITLTAKAGYTLHGVAAYFFTVEGATLVSNAANSGVVTVVFPSTAGTVEHPVTIDIAAIKSVTAPATGGIPVAAITENAQYTGTVTWNPNHPTFASATQYTATITLTAKAGYTLRGVAADFFTVAGANSASNAADSGVVTAVFPSTVGTVEHPVTIDIAAIRGVTVPVTNGIPVTSIIETAQFSGTVTWLPNALTFVFGTGYTAAITLKAKTGFTLEGVEADFFTVEGALSVSNSANSGVVTAAFPQTKKKIDTAIEGITVPVTGGTLVTSSIETDQYTGTVTWSPDHSTFASATQYTATITLTPKSDYTLQGVAANSFTVEGASSVSNSANSGVVTAVFPRTYTTIGIATIAGVTAPKVGETPVTSITETTQYTGTVTWEPNHAAFTDFNVYTATITLTPRAGYTLHGVPANFFTVGKIRASNKVNSGDLTVIFPLIPYDLGDTGPGGGKIFYYSEAGFTMTDTGEVCHYLEGAPADMTELMWASPLYTSINISGTETAIGAGRKNTALILAADANAPAAKACNDYNGGGKTDWFLPSKDELNALCENMSFFTNITIGWYWSSSQDNNSNAYCKLFQASYAWYSSGKNSTTNRVRAVRAF